MKLKILATYLDNLLAIDKIEDASLNGIQVANSGSVSKVAVAVDGSLAAFKQAAEADCDLVFVHHGLFWGKSTPIAGALYQRIKFLMDNDIALYTAHLPLDLHPELGNNAQIAAIMGWNVKNDFGYYRGIKVGKEVEFEIPLSLNEIVTSLEVNLGAKPQVWPSGPEKIKRLGLVSGGGLGMLQQAIECELDLYITGEPAHSAYWNAREENINVVFAGHYATETAGVKAVGEVVKKEFKLDYSFIDLPTGY